MLSCKNIQKKKSLHLIQNQNLLRLRLSYQEKIYYSDLFMMYQDNKTGNVYLEQFPKLLGIFGTDIAEDIAKRIFEIFSGNKNYITLSEYLKYIDVYHYGDETERCNVTCKLMDFNNNGNINLPNFKKYINLIIGAVRRVNPSLKSELFSEEDIEVLFNKISNNKEYFTYNEFATVYNEKPEILSWIDYFKNDNNEILLIIHQNIKKIIKNLYNFNYQINSTIKNYRHQNYEKGTNKNKFKDFLNLMIKIQNIFNNFKNNINIQNQQFMNFAKNNQISLRNLLSIISEIEDKDDEDFDDDNDDDNDNNNVDINEKNVDDINEKKSDTNKEKEQNYKKISEKKSSNKNLINNDKIKNSNKKNIFKAFNNRNRKNKLHTIKLFFDDIKKNLNENIGNDQNIDLRRKSYRTNNCLRNKLILENDKKDNNKDTNILYFNDNNNDNEDSSEVSDFILTEEEEDLSVFNKNINILNSKISLKLQNIGNSPFDNYNNKILKPIYKKSNEFDENKKTAFEESTKNKTLKEFNGFMKLRNSGNNNSIFSNDEKYIKYMDKLLKYFESTSKILFKSILNLNESYKWIELRYLKKTIINQQNMKRIENKKSLVREKTLNNNYERLSSFAVKNIPKNRLKATDDNFKILLNTIMGIQIAVESCPDISEIHDVKQFLNCMTYSIQTANLSKNKQEIFRIKEYAGIVFNSIRKLYGYNKDNFIQSISPQVLITEMIISNTTSIEELFNTGSSGSLFYYTKDGKLILKTISKSEYQTLKRILPKYYYHLVKYKNTFLLIFFGCYKLLKKEKKKKVYVYFIIMMNVFSTNKQIHVRFDLKGSTLSREVISKEEKQNKSYEDILGKYSFALKDLDFDYFKKNIYINENIYNDLIEQLNIDSLLLKECNINDYSLLIGIHKIKSCVLKNSDTNIYSNINDSSNSNNISLSSNNSETEKKSIHKDYMNKINNNNDLNKTEKNEGYLSENISFTSINYCHDKNNSEKKKNIKKDYNHDIILDDNGIYNDKYKEIYYIGMIDILTNYNVLKKCEYLYKSIRYCNNNMSCISPGKYQSRFINYIRKKILPNVQEIDSENNDFKRNKINTYNENKNNKIVLSNQLYLNLSEEILTSKNKSEIILNKKNTLFYNNIP